MNSIDIKIKNTEDGEKISLLAEFSLGVIKKERGVTEEGQKYITMPMPSKVIMKLMEDAILRQIDTENMDSAEEITALYEDIRNYMKEYAKSYMLDLLGVLHNPIYRDDNGNLVGFNKDYELNIITE